MLEEHQNLSFKYEVLNLCLLSLIARGDEDRISQLFNRFSAYQPNDYSISVVVHWFIQKKLSLSLTTILNLIAHAKKWKELGDILIVHINIKEAVLHAPDGQLKNYLSSLP